MREYIHKQNTAHMDKAVRQALAELVVSIRESITDRSSAADSRRILGMAALNKAVEVYALLEIPKASQQRCTHPNAYATGGRAMMYCPTCGPFNAMEE